VAGGTRQRTLRQNKSALLCAICDRTVDVADDGGGDFHPVLVLDILLDCRSAHTSAVTGMRNAFLQGNSKQKLKMRRAMKHTRMMSANGGCDVVLAAALDLVVLGLVLAGFLVLV